MLNPKEKQTHEGVSPVSCLFSIAQPESPAANDGPPGRSSPFPSWPPASSCGTIRASHSRGRPGFPLPPFQPDHACSAFIFGNRPFSQIHFTSRFTSGEFFSPVKRKNLGGNALTAKVTTKFTAKATIPTFKSLTACGSPGNNVPIPVPDNVI